MPTVQHLQYNSPMPLYSSGNIQTAYNQQVGGMNAPGSGYDIGSSATYRLIQEQEGGKPLPPQHSAVVEEHPPQEEYPHYRSYVNPQQQSPSFRRLQQYTPGGAPEFNDHYGAAEPQPMPTWHHHEPPKEHPMEPGLQQKLMEAERPKVPPPQQPSWTKAAERKQDTWRKLTVNTEPETRYPTGSEVQPDWHGASLRHQVDLQKSDYEQRHYPTGSEVQPDWRVLADKKQDRWQSHYGHYDIDTGHTMDGISPQRTYERPRAKSQEPSSEWRSRQQRQRTRSPSSEYGRRQFAMKPYVAPNVDRFQSRGGAGPAPLVTAHTIGRSTFSSRPENTSYGVYYGPTEGFKHGHRHDTSNYSTTTQSWHGTSGYRAPSSGGYHTSPRPPSNVQYEYTTPQHHTPAPNMYSPPAWRKTTSDYRRTETSARPEVQPIVRPEVQTVARPAPQDYSTWDHSRTVQTSSAPWSRESDAWKQRTAMEHDLQRRQEEKKYMKSTSSKTTTTQQASPGQSKALVVTTGEAARPQWQQAAGASTKAAASGIYMDPEGHKVNYTKEIYTSSDPGKEFSMMTQEEKKVLEEPVEPGVISRNVTTKYYKKSTYTSSTTTGTTQAPAITSGTTRSYQPAITYETRRGPVSPRVSQF